MLPREQGGDGADLVGGLDARGFLLGSAVAYELGMGILAIRKKGKLPPPVITQEYTTEYSTAALEIPADGVDVTGKRVVLVDDVLATGGTVGELLDAAMDPTISYDDLAVIRDIWPGKIVIKGVQNVEDSVRLRDAGVDATTQLAPGALHGFLNMVGVSADARVDVDAVARSPESKGGCGSYSMASWIALARSSPAIRAASTCAGSVVKSPKAE